MSYKALYRTYRPKTFEEVAGQKAIIQTLKNALENNKIAHAYLFCGPRGTGKTTMAKLFAKALNCEQGQGHQCNECENCIAINNGSHPDVIEIDAASNNGVEEVRNIIEKVKYLPIKGKYKVYIIDEVHMMSSGAFNALLKTLEEPPEHVVFILATTEPYKVLPTIISRCQRYDFAKVEDSDILNKLVEILEKEKVTYEEDALKIIVELADGGVRDALSMLDQVLAYSQNNIKVSDVLALFAIASKQDKIQLLISLSKKDIKVVLADMDKFVESGIDIKRLTTNLLEILRDLLVFEHGGEDYQLVSIREEDASELSKYINTNLCMQMIDVLLKAQSDYKNVTNIRSLFEIVLLKLCDINGEAKQNIEVKKPIIKVEEKVASEPTQPMEEKIVEKPIIEEKENEEEIHNNENENPEWLLDDDNKNDSSYSENDELTAEEMYNLDDQTIIDLMVLGNKQSRIDLTKKWPLLQNAIGDKKYGKAATLLRDGKLLIVSDNAIVLEYDFNRLVNKVNSKNNQKTLSYLIKKLINKDMFVYAMSRSRSIDLRRKFSNLSQINKLKKAKDINLQLPNMEEKEK
jgi:DNA polymerase-3 subunit gamma/tau